MNRIIKVIGVLGVLLMPLFVVAAQPPHGSCKHTQCTPGKNGCPEDSMPSVLGD